MKRVVLCILRLTVATTHPLSPVALLFAASLAAAQIPPVDAANQGFSMKLRYNNVGSFGYIACGAFNPGLPGGCGYDSVGWEYPVSSGQEHLYDGGVWIGGILDTSRVGTSSPLRLVSVTFEGMFWPFYEFFPGSSPSDTIWKVPGQWAPKPPGWDEYWGTDLPYRPYADDNQYCRYTDTSVQVAAHVPLRLSVIHSSYTWSDPSADGIHVVEYRISNTGNKVIDSAYVGLYLNPTFSWGGPYVDVYRYGFVESEDLAYVRDVVDSLATLCGVTFVSLPRPADSVRWAFKYYRGYEHPGTDEEKYGVLSSGVIMGDAAIIDGQMTLAAGPFTLHPAGVPTTEPLRVALAFLAAPNVAGLVQRAQRARELYLQGTKVLPQGSESAVSFSLSQNYPNPFNPTTTIQFTIVNRQWTIVKVYDVLGRDVATLVNEVKEPGTYTVTWDARGVSSGVYFCRLCVSPGGTRRDLVPTNGRDGQAGEFTATTKLLLLR